MKIKDIDREILRLTGPNVVSNISVPLLGMADTAIAGHIGSDMAIGALSIGTTVMNMIYWNCAFLRMGASGLVGQALGASDEAECKRLLIRAIGVAMLISMALLTLYEPIIKIAMTIMGGTKETMEMAKEYVEVRFLAVPATVTMFAIHGWFVGMQDSKTPMKVAVLTNIINIGASAYMAIECGMGIKGIALGTVVAQYIAVATSYILYNRRYGEKLPRVEIKKCFEAKEMKKFAKINGDIFLRTLCVVIAYTSFTSLSARYGDTTLSANALLMQLFTLFSYLIDGIAYAAESLSGLHTGAGDKKGLREASQSLLKWGCMVSIIYSITYMTSWRAILRLFGPTEEVINHAGKFIGWSIAIPLLGFLPFVVDGIMIGATKTRLLRNSVAIAMMTDAIITLATWDYLGEGAIWLGFTTFITMRGVLLIGELRKMTATNRQDA